MCSHAVPCLEACFAFIQPTTPVTEYSARCAYPPQTAQTVLVRRDDGTGVHNCLQYLCLRISNAVEEQLWYYIKHVLSPTYLHSHPSLTPTPDGHRFARWYRCSPPGKTQERSYVRWTEGRFRRYVKAERGSRRREVGTGEKVV
jgi:hypothetical protein